MKRIAIPVNDGILSGNLGECTHYEIFDIENSHVRGVEVVVPPENDVNTIPEWLVNMGVTDIIAYKIENKFISILINNKINLFIGIKPATTSFLIEDYQNGNLKSDLRIIHEITGENEKKGE